MTAAPETDAVTRAFEALEANRRALMVMSLPELFEEDPRRFQKFSLKLGSLLMDWSKTRVTATTMRLLVDLARAARLEEKRDAMFAGQRINTTEDRAVLHVALRNLSGTPILTDGRDVMPEVAAERERCLAFAEAVRSGALRGATASASTPSSISASAAPISAPPWPPRR